MARFVVVLPLLPLAAGDEFTVADWPLHVTLVEPFQTDLSADDRSVWNGSTSVTWPRPVDGAREFTPAASGRSGGATTKRRIRQV